MRIVRTEVDQLEYELSRLRWMKQELSTLSQTLEGQTELISQLLTDRGIRSKVYDGHRYTLVQAERTTINEAGLKKALGARSFNKLTTAKLDQAKVRDALSAGELDPVVLEQYAQNVLNKPAIRVTEVVDEGE